MKVGKLRTNRLILGRYAMVDVGISGDPIIVTTAATPAFRVYTTCALTTGTNTHMIFDATTTGVATAGSMEAVRVNHTISGTAKAWGAALYVDMDCTVTGKITGRAAALQVKLTTPVGATITSGEWSCAHFMLNCAGTGIPSNKHAVLSFSLSGTYVAQMQSHGYLFSLVGFGSATSTYMFQTNTAAAATHALRILIDGVAYYIMLTNVAA